MAETRFEGSGPVAQYWLANCEGFAVEGGARGVVEELIRDADPHVTTRIVVRTRGRRRLTIPARAVATVDPAERVLVVAHPRRTRSVRRRPSIRAPLASAARRSRPVWVGAAAFARVRAAAFARRSRPAWVRAAAFARVVGLVLADSLARLAAEARGTVSGLLRG